MLFLRRCIVPGPGPFRSPHRQRRGCPPHHPRKNRFAGVDAFLRLRSLEEERRQAPEQAVWNNRNRLERGNPAKVFRETF